MGAIGQLADVALELMSVRDGMVLDKLDQMQKQASDATTQSWLRALSIRDNHDCRVYNEKEHTGVEESQYILRFSNDRSSAEMLEYVIKTHKTMPIALMRIIANNCTSVEEGHAVLTRIVPAEFDAYMQDYIAYNKAKPTDPGKLLEELNLTPKRCLTSATDGPIQLNVISWDDIAAFHCRHLLNATCMEYYFYQHSYGVPELAKKTIEQTKQVFAKVDLRPFALAQFKLEKQEIAEVIKAGQDILLRSPELVTSGNWQSLRELAKQDENKIAIVGPEKWFEPAVPMGTAYFFGSRNDFPNSKHDLATLTKMREYCPFLYELNYDWALKKYGEHPTGDQFAEAFGKQVNYSVSALQVVAFGEEHKPEKYIPLKEKIAEIEPEAYFDLGAYCVMHNRPDQAAKYFEQGVKQSKNAVLVANQCSWLINYRFDHNQKNKAKELAEFAGEVFSYGGLNALARYSERAGDVQSAEKAYRDISERYDKNKELIAFLLRNASKNPKYAKEGQELAKPIFPEGMKKIRLAELTKAPTGGLLVTDPDRFADDSPLKKGVVIVGTNGYQVSNQAQYDVARNMVDGNILTAIFWGRQIV